MTASISAAILFYLLVRSITSIQLMAHGPLSNQAETSQYVLVRVVDTLAYLLPDLGRFTRTEWLLYPSSFDVLGPVAVQTLIYILLLSGVALFDLYRKNF